MARVGIALGSNLGDRLANLRAARAGLAGLAASGGVILQAPVYQTAPVLCPDGSADFYNTVVELEVEGGAGWLLQETQRLERRLGRESGGVRNAPRVIDIDLLYWGDAVVDLPGLVLPHPRLAVRRFVLQPLAEIRPDLQLPGWAGTAREMLAWLVSDEPPLGWVTDDW